MEIAYPHQPVLFSDKSYFSDYCKDVADKHCPFLIAAESKGLLFSQSIELTCQDMQSLQERIFYYGILYTEQLRRIRTHTECGALACENVIFNVATYSSKQISGEHLLSWPHWLLKSLYSRVGIMFGKFWIGETIKSRKQEPIITPPCNFISIRSVIKNKDPYFFTKSQHLLKELIHSDDRGQDVHKELGIIPSKCDIHSLNSLLSSNYYMLLKKFFEEKLKTH